MILDRKMTTVAYRCPHCGSTVKSVVGAFTLNADLIRLKCPCGESEATIEMKKDGKVRLTVPCFLCPRPHIYNVSDKIFFGHDVFAYPCSLTGVDICFSGSKESVQQAVDESDEALAEMLGESDFDEISCARNERVFDDPQIMDIVLFVVGDLAEEGKIHCECADGGDYEVAVSDDSVTVKCRRCGKSREIPADSTIAANAFLHCDELFLT